MTGSGIQDCESLYGNMVATLGNIPSMIARDSAKRKLEDDTDVRRVKVTKLSGDVLLEDLNDIDMYTISKLDLLLEDSEHDVVINSTINIQVADEEDLLSDAPNGENTRVVDDADVSLFDLTCRLEDELNWIVNSEYDCGDIEFFGIDDEETRGIEETVVSCDDNDEEMLYTQLGMDIADMLYTEYTDYIYEDDEEVVIVDEVNIVQVNPCEGYPDPTDAEWGRDDVTYAHLTSDQSTPSYTHYNNPIFNLDDLGSVDDLDTDLFARENSNSVRINADDYIRGDVGGNYDNGVINEAGDAFAEIYENDIEHDYVEDGVDSGNDGSEVICINSDNATVTDNRNTEDGAETDVAGHAGTTVHIDGNTDEVVDDEAVDDEGVDDEGGDDEAVDDEAVDDEGGDVDSKDDDIDKVVISMNGTNDNDRIDDTVEPCLIGFNCIDDTVEPCLIGFNCIDDTVEPCLIGFAPHDDSSSVSLDVEVENSSTFCDDDCESVVSEHETIDDGRADNDLGCISTSTILGSNGEDMAQGGHPPTQNHDTQTGHIRESGAVSEETQSHWLLDEQWGRMRVTNGGIIMELYTAADAQPACSGRVIFCGGNWGNMIAKNGKVLFEIHTTQSREYDNSGPTDLCRHLGISSDIAPMCVHVDGVANDF